MILFFWLAGSLRNLLFWNWPNVRWAIQAQPFKPLIRIRVDNDKIGFIPLYNQTFVPNKFGIWIKVLYENPAEWLYCQSVSVYCTWHWRFTVHDIDNHCIWYYIITFLRGVKNHIRIRENLHITGQQRWMVGLL